MKKAMGKVFKHAQKIVELKSGLNFDHFVKICKGITNPQRLIGDMLLKKIKRQAAEDNNLSVLTDISIAHGKKVRQEKKNVKREFTILRSKQAHIDLRPMVDSDKQYFLNEFLKLLAFAENYYKQKQYLAWFNSGMVIAFICI